MIVYLGIILFLIIWKCNFLLTKFNADFLSRESSYAVKGVFILLIFASHFSQYVPEYSKYFDLIYWDVRSYLGQLVVTMFLFYSGYGVMKQSVSKGEKYIHSFPKKRILATLLIYDLSQMLFFSIQVIFGKHYSMNDFFLSMVAWKSFGNDNWYIFVVLVLYIISWIAFVAYKNEKKQVIIMTICTIGFIQFLTLTGKGSHWYNTLICYPAGASFFLLENKILLCVKNNLRYFALFVIILLTFIFLHKYWKKSVFLYEVVSLLFVSLVLLVTLKIQIRNRFLIFCGKHLQGLFLLHKIPMILLKNLEIIQKNIYISFAFCIAVTFALEYVFTRVTVSLKDI